MMLVSLEEVKTGLRVDTSDDDALLELLLGAASEMVINHLKGQAGELIDLDEAAGNSPAGANAPDAVKTATIMMTGILYRNPDADADKIFQDGKLPLPVAACLKLLRDPTLA